MHTCQQLISNHNIIIVCLSYKMTWQYLRMLVQEMGAEAKVKSGHQLWSYDNFKSIDEIDTSGKVPLYNILVKGILQMF